MATYQGSAFIRQQLDSIISQTYTDWEMIIRDDLSNDGTIEIIKEYATRDERIKIMDTEGEHGSATINFSVLFDYAYRFSNCDLMFADQDDIWYKDKVASSVNFIRDIESKVEAGTPVMVYSAIQYIDVNNQIIEQELYLPASLDFKVLVNQNHAYGCTMILNRSLVEKIKHIPITAENHDYWISLVACGLGKAQLNPAKLLGYRQHANNVSANVDQSKLSARINRYLKNTEVMLPLLRKNFYMISHFYDIYGDSLNLQDQNLIAGYIAAFKKGDLPLMSFMMTNKFRKGGMMQTLVHYYLLLMLRTKIIRQK